jgi:uncharacterized integral membrane protein
MRVIYTIIIILLMLFVITFSLSNTAPVQLQYYNIIDVTLPTYMLMFISFLAAVVFTGFMGVIERFRLNRTISHLNRTIKDLRREIRDSKKDTFVEEPNLSPGHE